MKKAITLTTTDGDSKTILSTDILVVEAHGANYKVVYRDSDSNVKSIIVSDTLADIRSQAECLFEFDGIYLSAHHVEFVAGNADGAILNYNKKKFTSSEAKSTVVDNINQATESASALTDGASIDLSAPKHTLTSDEAAITFTISSTSGDDMTLEVTLNATSATYTFPATALCVSEGTASGDNTLSLSGVSGDKYIIGIKKVGSAYYVASKNFGQ